MRADVSLPHLSQSSMDVHWSFFITPCPVYSFSATYRASVVLWHIAELVAYRDNGSDLNEKRASALWHSFSLQGVQGGGGENTNICPPPQYLSLNKLVQAVCMEFNKLTTNKFVRENNRRSRNFALAYLAPTSIIYCKNEPRESLNDCFLNHVAIHI